MGRERREERRRAKDGPRRRLASRPRRGRQNADHIRIIAWFGAAGASGPGGSVPARSRPPWPGRAGAVAGEVGRRVVPLAQRLGLAE